MSDLLSAILNRGAPPATPAPQNTAQPNPLMLLLQKLIMKQPGPADSSPSVFDARDAIRQHNQQLEQSLNYQ